MARQPQFPDHKDIERRMQGPRDFVRDRDASTWQSEDHDIAYREFEEALGELDFSALAGDRAKLAKIAQRYDAGGVAVAVATATTNGLSIRLHEYGEDTGTPPTLTVTGAAGPDLFSQAVAETASALEQTWKQATLLDPNHPAELSLQVSFANLKDWLATEQELQDTPASQSLNLTSFTRSQAEVTLHYLGTTQGLALTLAQRRLKLADQNGYWALQRMAPPAADGAADGAKNAPANTPAGAKPTPHLAPALPPASRERP